MKPLQNENITKIQILVIISLLPDGSSLEPSSPQAASVDAPSAEPTMRPSRTDLRETPPWT